MTFTLWAKFTNPSISSDEYLFRFFHDTGSSTINNIWMKGDSTL